MNQIKRVAAIALAIGFSTGMVPPLEKWAQAQSPAPERIDWMKKGRNLVWEVKVPAKSTKFYVFRATKGQVLSLSLVDDTKQGSMDLGKYSVEPNTGPMTMTVPVTKDYTLSVTNNSSRSTSFRIGFGLRDTKPACTSPKFLSGEYQARFAAGASSAVYSGNLAADPGQGNVTYVFHAQKGQRVSFLVEAAKDFYVSLALPKAQDPEVVAETGKTHEYKVVKTGKHYLTIVNHTGKTAPFILRLKVVNQAVVNSPTRLQLPKGEQVAEIKGTLAPGASKRYVAYVLKGNMISIVPQDESTKKIRCRLDGKAFDFLDSTSTEHQKQSKDHIIEFSNPGRSAVPFHFWIGFSQHG